MKTSSSGLDVFGIGSDGLPYFQRRDVNGGWSGWVQVPYDYLTMSSLVAVTGGVKDETLFAIDSHGRIGRTSIAFGPGLRGETVFGATFNGWTVLPALPSVPVQISAADVAGSLFVGALLSDGAIWYAKEKPDHNFAPFIPLLIRSRGAIASTSPSPKPIQIVMTSGAYPTGPGAAARPVVYMLHDGVVSNDSQQPDGTWPGFQPLPFFVNSPLVQFATAANEGPARILAADSQGAVYYVKRLAPLDDGSFWAPSVPLGGKVAALVAATTPAGIIDIFGVDPDTHDLMHDDGAAAP